jgi:glycosyltransferase involved in cell wall biosynthesis
MPDEPRSGSLPRTVSVVVMAYNEVQSLEATCREILAVLDTLGEPAELLIVDDGSTDGTSTRAEALAERDSRVRVIHHGQNRGLGGVYRTGFQEACGTFVTFFPADGQFPATIIADFLPRMSQQDMVLGFLPSGERSFVAEALSGVERLLYRVLLGRIPRFQGILMFRRELLAQHRLRSDGRGWAILMEFIVRCSRADHRMVSTPTDVRPRAHGTSKVNNLRTIWSNLRQVVALRRILSDESVA